MNNETRTDPSPSLGQESQGAHMSGSNENTIISPENHNGSDETSREISSTEKRSFQSFLFVVSLDLIFSFLLLLPSSTYIADMQNVSQSWHYSLHGTLWDLALISAVKAFAMFFCVYWAYRGLANLRQTLVNPIKPDGTLKSDEELEDESMEQPIFSVLKHHATRLSFLCEAIGFLSACWAGAKSLARLNVEIGVFGEAHEHHPVFWISLLVATIFNLAECSYIESIMKIAAKIGKYDRELSEHLTALNEPLLTRPDSSDEESPRSEQSGQRRPENRQKAHTTSMGDLFRIGYADRGLIYLACIFLAGTSLCQVYIPKVTGDILNDLINGAQGDGYILESDVTLGDKVSQIPGFMRNVSILVVVSILGGVFGGIRGAIFTIVGARVNVRLRVELLDALLAQEVGFYDTSKTGDLTSRLTSDTTIIGSSLTTNFNIFLRSVLRVVGVLIFMTFISWQLTLMAFMTVPIVSILSKWYGRYLRRLSKLQQKKLADGNSVAEHSLSSISTVQAFGAELVELNEFELCMKNYLALNSKAATAALGYSTCLTALPQLVKALVMFYGGLLVQSDGPDHINGGQLVSFVLYLTFLSDSFNSLGGIYASLVRAVGAADKVFELMQRKPRRTVPREVDNNRVSRALEQKNAHVLGANSTKIIEHRAAGLYPETCDGQVVLENVIFQYPARPQRTVLDGINLSIPSGSIVALVGASGSGKSSVMKLVQNFYEPSNGNVSIDGTNVQELSPDWLCRQMTVVSQEPNLFSRSIKENIAYGLTGDERPSDAEIEEAARLANATEFIESLPMKYDTEVGERGMQLSGGQKQRIAIARALVRKPKILLLDEATSSLDVSSEYHVQSAIDEMISRQRGSDERSSTGMTVIIIAHRLSTIRNADVIFVVEDGKIVESGSHTDLLEENGPYSLLFRRQLQGENSTS